MKKDAVEQILHAYLEAYGNVSVEERKRLLAESVGDDVVSENPGDEADGIEALTAHIEQFQQRLPGSHFKLNSFKCHHQQVLTEWTLYKADGAVVTTAHTYGVFNGQGRLKKLIGFF
jgi:limonene-1,2-epoxide hydrolase